MAGYPLDDVSVLVSVTDGGRPRYQGTAFPFLRLGLWVTAAHCVHNWRGPGTLGLLSSMATPPRLDGIRNFRRHPTLDVALLWSERQTAVPFPELGHASWGNEVAVVGYPEDLFIDAEGQDRPRARLLKGHIQRVEDSQSEADRSGDFELSFACPGGLSGSPVVLQGGRVVVGVVIGNHESSITDYQSEDVTAGGQTSRLEVRRIVSFGAAVGLARAGPWLSAVGHLGPE